MNIFKTKEDILQRAKDDYQWVTNGIKADFRRDNELIVSNDDKYIRFVDEGNDTYGEVFNLEFHNYQVKYVIIKRKLLYTTQEEIIKVPYKTVITGGIERHNTINEILKP